VHVLELPHHFHGLDGAGHHALGHRLDLLRTPGRLVQREATDGTQRQEGEGDEQDDAQANGHGRDWLLNQCNNLIQLSATSMAPS